MWKTQREWEIPCALGGFGQTSLEKDWEMQSAKLGSQGARAAARDCSTAEMGKQAKPPLQNILLETKETSEFKSIFPEENKPKDFSILWHTKEQKEDL